MSQNSSIIDRARPEVQAMPAYFSIRNSLPTDKEYVFLGASELPCEPIEGSQGYSRYNAQQPPQLIKALSSLYGTRLEEIMVSRGADEAIDIVIRTFCGAQDNIIICPPTFPMYAQSGLLHGTTVKIAPLNEDFSLDIDTILQQADARTKIVFICSPNNPTGNTVDPAIVRQLCIKLSGRALVVVDEAYIDFCPELSCQALLKEYANVAFLRTLSKGYALAGVRCGALIAQSDVIALCKKVLPPYPIPVPVMEAVLRTLQPDNIKRLKEECRQVLETRDWFITELSSSVPCVDKVYPTYGNFLLMRVKNAEQVMRICLENGFILRDQSSQLGLKNAIRLSIGTRAQMARLLNVLKGIQS